MLSVICYVLFPEVEQFQHRQRGRVRSGGVGQAGHGLRNSIRPHGGRYVFRRLASGSRRLASGSRRLASGSQRSAARFDPFVDPSAAAGFRVSNPGEDGQNWPG